MLRFGLIICIGILLSACGSSAKHFGAETRKLDIPEYEEAGLDEEDINVHTCIYDAINESLQTRTLAWWDSGSYNCTTSIPYRGRLVVKLAEPGFNYLCVQVFEYSQTKLPYGWTMLQAKEFAACRPYSDITKWRISYDLDILEWTTLQDIMS